MNLNKSKVWFFLFFLGGVLFQDFHHQSQLGVLPAFKLHQLPSKPA